MNNFFLRQVLFPLAALTVPAALAVGQAPVRDARIPSAKPAPVTASPYSGTRGSCTQFSTTLCLPLDATHTVLPFPSSVDPCHRNDDDSGQLMLNGWSFDFYGSTFNDPYINSNGNVSFGVPFSTFSASGFPVAGFPMLAAFWGDVDTRADSGSDGAVWYREWSVAAGDSVNRLVITWDHVGYYDSQVDKLNTFQLILTDGNDPLIGAGNNVCFCYDDMQWTTGSASGGTGGFGGTPATVGANQGNGLDFFQVGRFDHAGMDYDGPGGNADGVDFLDNATYCFDVSSGSTFNVPPVFVNPTTQYSVALGQTLNFTVDAIGPETGETVTSVVSSPNLANFTWTATPGNPASLMGSYTPAAVTELGTHEIVVTSTDDGTPPLSSVLVITVLVTPDSVGQPVCDPAVANSTGRSGAMWVTGSDVATANGTTLVAADLPLSSLGYFIVSQEMNFVANPGGSMGNICISSSAIGRYNANTLDSGSTGTVELTIDLTATPLQPAGPISIGPGQTWYWQYWYQDATTASATSNFTNAVGVVMQ